MSKNRWKEKSLSGQTPIGFRIGGRQILAAGLTLCLAAGMLPASAFAADNSPSADGRAVQVVSDPGKVSNAIAQDYGEDGLNTYEEMEINAGTGTVTVDGEKTTLSDALEVSEKQEEAMTSGTKKENKEKILACLENEEALSVSENGNTITVRAPYQMQRLIVMTSKKIADTYGATKAVYYSTRSAYILNYDSQEAAAQACEKLKKTYGSTNVFPDSAMNLSAAEDGDQKTDSGEAESANNVTTEETSNATAEEASNANTKAANAVTTKAANAATTKSVTTKAVSTKSTDAVSWGTAYAGLDVLKEAANADSTLKKTTVAIIDTGINKDHAMFKGRTISSKSRAFDSISQGLKLDYSYQDIDQDKGHGTHVAGIVADGTSRQVGLLILRTYARTAGGGTTASLTDIASAIDYAVKQGVSVINISGGENIPAKEEAYPDKSDYEAAMAQYKYMEMVLKDAYDKGIAVFVASGNKQSDTDSCKIEKEGAYPARSSYAYAVGAIGKDYKRASYSYYGSSLDFVAPGTDIVSASAWDNTDTITESGTSMAAPNISALAAMIKVYHPDYKRTEIVRVLRQRSSLGADGDRTNQLGWGSAIIGKTGHTALKKTQKISGVKNSYTVNYNESALVLSPKTSRDTGLSIVSNKPRIVSVNGKGAVTAKGIGVVQLTIHAQSSTSYDYAEKKVTVRSVVRTAKIKSLTAGKKKLTVKWKKGSNISGCVIRYATKKNMKDAKTVTVTSTSKTKSVIKGLKAKKKYYVQMRFYKILEDGRYYGAWSAVKNKKTK